MSKKYKVNEFGEIIGNTNDSDTSLNVKREEIRAKLLNDKSSISNIDNGKYIIDESGQVILNSGVGFWGVLYFFLPLVGIIMYFVYKNRGQKKKQKQAIIIAIIPIILNIILTIIENS
jgi:cbb3-type cytochrome oxidase subunit 3